MYSLASSSERDWSVKDGSCEAVRWCVGKPVTALSVTGSDLNIDFADARLRIFDDGQSCCESRYMVCDDDLTAYIGAQLMDVTIEDAPDMPDEYGVHQVQFLHVKTSAGSFTVSSHNEHNGYYGGFYISAHLSHKY